jgi:hypothetical protein
VQVATAGNLPLAGEGEAIGKVRKFILSNHRSSGNLLDRLDGEEIVK